MDSSLFIILACLSSGLLFLIFFSAKVCLKNRDYESRYAEAISVEKAAEKANKEKSQVDGELSELRKVYKEKLAISQELLRQIALFDEDIELAELGFYKPHFDFDTSEKFKEKISDTRTTQKELIRNKKAIHCRTEWQIEGSKAKGRSMSNKGIRLTARAFNNECDAAIANVSWNNVVRMELRIRKAWEAINKLNEVQTIVISSDYLDLKVEELRLHHEYQEKKQAEKEERIEARREMREEAKLRKDVEKAVKEETKYEEVLERAKAEAESATGEQLEKLCLKINELSEQLAEAHAKSERALSMAQQTRSGYIYIISNLGSFGENIFKIGMTRRLDPMDRVKELGDASVPFVFDVHALIYSEDAPSLEAKLHSKFGAERVNLVNNRKEFFNVSLEDIETELIKLFPEAEFVHKVEAREFKETEAIIIQKNLKQDKTNVLSRFPAEI